MTAAYTELAGKLSGAAKAHFEGDQAHWQADLRACDVQPSRKAECLELRYRQRAGLIEVSPRDLSLHLATGDRASGRDRAADDRRSRLSPLRRPVGGFRRSDRVFAAACPDVALRRDRHGPEVRDHPDVFALPAGAVGRLASPSGANGWDARFHRSLRIPRRPFHGQGARAAGRLYAGRRMAPSPGRTRPPGARQGSPDADRRSEANDMRPSCARSMRGIICSRTATSFCR